MLGIKQAPLAVALLCAWGLPGSVQAQTQPPPAAPAPAAAAPPPAAAAAPAQDLLNAEQLEQLVAPIALYPDNLLAQTLMASTYPLEVVEASRWVAENKKLKGDQLRKAVDAQTWDDSVKSLVATPSVLDMMNTKLSWTTKLGDAVLAQQSDVMDAAQRLRARAQAAKKLETTKEQKVTVKTEQNKQVIVIEPAQPDTVYVPYYDPAVVYGAWPYPAYPPYYFPQPAYYGGALLATGLAFGAGVALGAWASRGYWGGGCGWGNNNININRSTNINNVSGNWRHDPSHRQGVRYSNANVANQFGKGNQVRGNNNLADRGRQNAGDRVGDRGDRPNAGDRGDRAGDRGGDRGGGQQKGAGDRGGGQQKGAGDRGGQKAGSGGQKGGGGQKAGAGNRPSTGAGGGGARPGGGARDSAMNIGGGGRAAAAQSARGHASLAGGGFGGGGGGFQGAGGGGFRGGGGGGFSGGGGGGFGGGGRGGGGGRRSDITLKHDIRLLGHLDNGLGFYRFSYNGSDKAYVGVMAQEVQFVMPEAVTRGADGTLRVCYETLGVKFQTYDQWIGSGGRVPVRVRAH